MKTADILIWGISKEEESEKDRIFEEINGQNTSDLTRNTSIYVSKNSNKHQVELTQRYPTEAHHCQNAKNQQILGDSKREVTYVQVIVNEINNWPRKSWMSQSDGMMYSKCEKKGLSINNTVQNNPSKISNHNLRWSQINKNWIFHRISLQDIFKGTLQAEMKGYWRVNQNHTQTNKEHQGKVHSIHLIQPALSTYVVYAEHFWVAKDK